MTASIRTLFFATLFLVSSSAHAQIVTYTFGSTASPTTAAATVDSNVTASVLSGNLGSPSTGGTSPLYTAGSGGAYFSASAWTGSSPGTNYFQFTITPDAGYLFSTTSISFGYRSTATGPIAFSIRSSADAYASSLASGTLTNTSAWFSSGSLSTSLSNLTTATTFRIYGSGASAGGGTFRVDDVTLNGTSGLAPIPEPSTFAVILGALALAGVALQRRRNKLNLSQSA